MGGGGYVAAPVVLAAVTLRVPVVLTEADSRLGLTNRAFAPFARRVCLSFPPAAAQARTNGRRARRYRVTGRPTYAPARERGAARELFGVAGDESCLLVFGGSLGARSINMAAIEAFAGASFRVLHVCGRRDYEELAATPLRPGYTLFEYLEPARFAQALAAADLAVARAGGSVFEIAAQGLPAILVPYPRAAGGHQAANAAWMAGAGAAAVIEDGELTPARLAREVAALLADRPRLATMAAASSRLARPEAAQVVAGELLEAARA
jgi:UDP-N-acetylglucosamine--N-acetylmuramyl-(pentapeptide) pyrophosphoryl-undecaprenol N-acetylglucosamine transferase